MSIRSNIEDIMKKIQKGDAVLGDTIRQKGGTCDHGW